MNSPIIGLTGTYKSSDPIKNFKLRVHLESVTSILSLPKTHRTEEQNIFESAESSTYKEKLLVSWQQKIFSVRERKFYKNKENCSTPLSNIYHDTLRDNPSDSNNLLFTYTNNDQFTVESGKAGTLTTDSNETPTVLEEIVSSHSRKGAPQAYSQTNAYRSDLIYSSDVATINADPLVHRKNLTVEQPLETMYVLANFSNQLSENDSTNDTADTEPADASTGEELSVIAKEFGKLKREEKILCVLKYFRNGTLTVQPNFNSHSKEPYQLEINVEDSRKNYTYTLEDASEKMTLEEYNRHKKLKNELYSRRAAEISANLYSEMEIPKDPNVLRLIVYGEISSASGFEYDDLACHYIIKLPQNWSLNDSASLSGVTFRSRSITGTSEHSSSIFENTCQHHFGFPFELDLYYRNNDGIMPSLVDFLPHWPQILLCVVSIDDWERYRVEGYGSTVFPVEPGSSIQVVHTWRPAGSNPRLARLRRYFIGGCPELEDPSFCSQTAPDEAVVSSQSPDLPDGIEDVDDKNDGEFKEKMISSDQTKNPLSRLGLQTISSGKVKISWNILHQSRAFMEKSSGHKQPRVTGAKQKDSSLVDDKDDSNVVLFATSTKMKQAKERNRKSRKLTGVSAIQASVQEILDAFHGARERMLAEQENLNQLFKSWSFYHNE